MHVVSPFCVPSQELEYERRPAALEVASDGLQCKARAAPSDVIELYRQLRAAPANTDDFELLAAEFNRRCSEDPKGVLRALEEVALV